MWEKAFIKLYRNRHVFEVEAINKSYHTINVLLENIFNFFQIASKISAKQCNHYNATFSAAYSAT